MTSKSSTKKDRTKLSDYLILTIILDYIIPLAVIFSIIFIIYKSITTGELIAGISYRLIVLLGFVYIFRSYYRRYKLRLLIICILLVSSGYFYTYQMQYDFPQCGYSISSHVFLEKSENFTFHRFKQGLFYQSQNKIAYLSQELQVSNSQPIETHISFRPPDDLVDYNITVVADIGSNKTVLLSLNKIDNPGFKSKLEFPPGAHTIKMDYAIKDVEPVGVVRFWIFGENGKPKIEDLRASVTFSRLKYQCSNPCVIIAGNKGYYTTYDKTISYQNADVPAYTFHIYLDNSNEMTYVIWTSHKGPVILRNLLFALLVGLFVETIGILIKEREEYLQLIQKAKTKIGMYYRKLLCK